MRILADYPVRCLHAVGDRREKFGEPDRDLADIDSLLNTLTQDEVLDLLAYLIDR